MHDGFVPSSDAPDQLEDSIISPTVVTLFPADPIGVLATHCLLRRYRVVLASSEYSCNSWRHASAIPRSKSCTESSRSRFGRYYEQLGRPRVLGMQAASADRILWDNFHGSSYQTQMLHWNHRKS
jgi:hypothetical protein